MKGDVDGVQWPVTDEDANRRGELNVKGVWVVMNEDAEVAT